jgi:hypothetical protein
MPPAEGDPFIREYKRSGSAWSLINEARYHDDGMVIQTRDANNFSFGKLHLRS